MLKKSHRPSGQKNEISLGGCRHLKKLSNSVKIEQIGQVTEKLWSKQWIDENQEMLKKSHHPSGQKNEISLGLSNDVKIEQIGQVTEKLWLKQWIGCRSLKKLSNGVNIEQIGQVTEKLWLKQWTGCRPLKKLSNSVKIEQIGQVTEKLWSKQWTGSNPLKNLSNDVKIEQIGQVTGKLWSKEWTGKLYPFKKSFHRCKDRANRTINGEVIVKIMDRGCSPLKSFPTMGRSSKLDK
ncbi:hypothetical protein OROMI_034974 [Orobanche minor]